MCAFLIIAAVASACATAAGENAACDGLVYKEYGLERTEYLPCAGEMVAALDRLAPQIDRMLDGDRTAQSEARATLRELRRLMKKAGWRDMLERWDDRALNDLNLDIWNTYNHHEACLMVAGGLFGRQPAAADFSEGVRSECRAYESAYQDARYAYRSLR